VIHHDRNGFGFGQTCTTGFVIFRWDRITDHPNEQPIRYRVRWGEPLDTIAFDWKVSPERTTIANQMPAESQLLPGQSIILPAP
jgi:hypothetical protein